jgi:lysyl hydroxylase/galactosyltransferase/glucosyltransferase
VFWFPTVTDEFCDDLILIMEDFGEWSGGRQKHYDARIGGIEEYPTVDIHLKQIKWQEHWEYFLENIYSQMVEAIFIGYSKRVYFIKN